MEGGGFQSRQELEQTFPSVDFHARHGAYIFDLTRGWRLVAYISFSNQEVIIDEIMNHDDYMRWSGER